MDENNILNQNENTEETLAQSVDEITEKSEEQDVNAESVISEDNSSYEEIKAENTDESYEDGDYIDSFNSFLTVTLYFDAQEHSLPEKNSKKLN